jgi:cell division protein FtsN
MTHDFAKKPKATKTKKKPPKTQVPGWVWLLTGIATGLFISFLVYLSDITPSPAPEPKTSAKASKPTEPATEKKDTGTRFDFYTLLPEREVIVPVDKDEYDTEPVETFHYILQAGSFKQAADADRLRAELILLGLEARVDAVTVSNGDIWHRVQVGPFESRSKLSKARSTLISRGVDTLLLKRKIEG